MKDLFVKNFCWLFYLYAAYYYYFMYEEQEVILNDLNTITSAKAEKVKKTTDKIKEIENFKKNLEASQNRVNEVIKQIEKTQQLLPNDSNDTMILDMLDNDFKKINITSPVLKSGNIESRQLYLVKDYLAKGNGTFLQALVFIERLNRAERIFNIKSVTMKPITTVKKSRFQMVDFEVNIQTYSYDPKGQIQ